MDKTLSITDARKQLPQLVKDASTLSTKSYITVQGSPAAVLINPDELAQLEAAIEILSDKQTMKSMSQSQKDIQNDDLVDWNELKEELVL